MELNLAGKIVKYSPEDYEKISKYKWYQDGKKCHANVEGKTVKMHRFLTNAPKGTVVDHINNDPLDNRGENLRLTNAQGNAENKQKMEGTLSLYKGVTFDSNSNKFKSRINFKKRHLNLGNYLNEIHAAEAYDLFIVHHEQSCFKINFPEKYEDYLTRNIEGKYYTEFTGIKHECDKYFYKFGNHKYIFDDKIDAANHRDQIIVKHCLKKQLNFPEKYPEFFAQKTKTDFKEITNNPSMIHLIIPSNPESIVIIDKEDYNNVKHLTFRINNQTKAVTGSNHKLLHRMIMNISDPSIYIDHIDRNPLNNSKSNLRLSNSLQNSQNRTKTKGTTSSYIGVSFEKSTKKWRAALRNNGKDIFIGRFADEITAAKERNKYILSLKDSHHTLNKDDHGNIM